MRRSTGIAVVALLVPLVALVEPVGARAGGSGSPGPNAESRSSPLGRFTEFPVPTEDAQPYGIAVGADGRIWFAESGGNKIGRLNPDGTFDEFPLSFPDSGPRDLTLGPDGSLWFTLYNSDVIGRIDPRGRRKYFPVPTAFAQPLGIAAAPDGTIWFTESSEANKIGILTPPLGYVEEIALPGPIVFPSYIAAGPDGAMWFTGETGDLIGRITLEDRQVTTFPIPTQGALPWNITAGPDGAMWFTELGGRNIGRITTDGQVTEYPIPEGYGGVTGIAPGFDGRLWFTQSDHSSIGVVSTAGRFGPIVPTGRFSFPTEVAAGPDGSMWFTERNSNNIVRVAASTGNLGSVISTDIRFIPGQVTIDVGGTVRWLFQGPGEHTVTDTSGLFDTGPVPVGGVRSFTYTSAGSFPYVDTLHPSLTGVVRVRPAPSRTDRAARAMSFWRGHGYLVPDPESYLQLKAEATGQAGQPGPGSGPTVVGPAAASGGPVAGPSFQGQQEPDVTPPDPTGAIGPNGYVQMINLRIAIYDRTGGLTAEAAIEQLVGGNHFHYTDPQVLWDPHTQRFYYLIWDFTSATFRWGFSRDDDPRTLDDASFCSYISGFGYSAFDIPDYPKLGQTKDFLLVGVNHFDPFVEFRGGDLLWIEKPQSKEPITTCPEGDATTGRFAALKDEDGVLANAPEPAQQADPSSVGFVVSIPFTLDGNGHSLTVFAVTKNPRTGRPVLGPPHSIQVPAYSYPAYAPQCGESGTLLDTLDGRFEHAVSAIDPRTGQTEIWTAHAVFGGAGSEVRWYEITPRPLPTPTIAQSGAASHPTLLAFNGSIAPDRTVSPAGRAHGASMVMGFTTSSASDCPAVQMVSKVGSRPQSGFVEVTAPDVELLDFSCLPICRWGDYGGAAPDPGAPLAAPTGSVWLTNEVPVGQGSGPGGTWIWRARP